MTGARHSQRSVLLMRRYRGTARPYGGNARAGPLAARWGCRRSGCAKGGESRVFEKLVFKQSYEGCVPGAAAR